MRIPFLPLAANRSVLLTLCGAAIIGGVIWATRTRAARLQKLQSGHQADADANAETRDQDQRHDQTLQDTFPASDAPATRDYAIPVNAH